MGIQTQKKRGYPKTRDIYNIKEKMSRGKISLPQIIIKKYRAKSNIKTCKRKV